MSRFHPPAARYLVPARVPGFAVKAALQVESGGGRPAREDTRGAH